MTSKYFRYLCYVLRHKWYVFLESCKLGIPLRGILHDLSKFKPSQWFPYVNYFCASDAAKPKAKEAFEYACLEHYHLNPHHWQYWILRKDNGETKILPMSDQYRREMLADWRGAGRAKNGYNDSREWYLKNKDKMLLHQETRDWVEKQLNVKTY